MNDAIRIVLKTLQTEAAFKMASGQADPAGVTVTIFTLARLGLTCQTEAHMRCLWEALLVIYDLHHLTGDVLRHALNQQMAVRHD